MTQSKVDAVAGGIIAEMLGSSLMRAYDTNRNQLLFWETKGCRYVAECISQGFPVNGWTAHFVWLNLGAILEFDNPIVNYKLKANPCPDNLRESIKSSMEDQTDR